MYQVIKRDGKAVDFDLSKINTAIKKAFNAQGKNYHPSVIDFMA
jgi:ribonucleoside-triphosphate reductase